MANAEKTCAVGDKFTADGRRWKVVYVKGYMTAVPWNKRLHRWQKACWIWWDGIPPRATKIVRYGRSK